jgi:hypothetical protein
MLTDIVVWSRFALRDSRKAPTEWIQVIQALVWGRWPSEFDSVNDCEVVSIVCLQPSDVYTV